MLYSVKKLICQSVCRLFWHDSRTEVFGNEVDGLTVIHTVFSVCKRCGFTVTGIIRPDLHKEWVEDNQIENARRKLIRQYAKQCAKDTGEE